MPDLITTEAQLREIEGRSLSASAGSGHFSETNRSSSPVINIMLPCVRDSPKLISSLRAAWAQRDEARSQRDQAIIASGDFAEECGRRRGQLEDQNERLCAEIEKLRKSDGVASRNYVIAMAACAFAFMTAFAVVTHSQAIRDRAQLEQGWERERSQFNAVIDRQRMRGDEWKADFQNAQKRFLDDEDELARLRRNRAILQPYIDTGRLAIVDQP